MYHVSAQGIDERMINVHYYYYVTTTTLNSVYNLAFESECYCSELPSIIAIIIAVTITYHQYRK